MEEIKIRERSPQPQLEIKQEKSLEFISQSIKDYEEVGDEEAIFMLALTLDHPEWKDTILEQIKQHKPHVKNVLEILERMNKEYFSSGWQSQIQADAEDVLWWTEHLPEAKKRIADILVYFCPSANKIVKKITIVPSDKLLSSKDTGSSFDVNDTIVIMSHTENLDNFEHEFLHSIINPLTEKISKSIPEEKIVALASNKLKNEKMYGNHALSLLNEELIRTYNDLIKNKNDIRTFDDFNKMVDSLDSDNFNKINENESITKMRFNSMNITSLEEFKLKIKEYYDKYEKNELREKVFQLYKKYDTEKSIHQNIRFEDFLLKEIGLALNS